MKKRRKQASRRESRSNNRNLGFIVLRYVFLLATALFLAYSKFFYSLLLKLTIYPTNFILNPFYDSFVYQSSILIEGFNIEIISACVALSAYFLLLILNLTTPMSAKNRIKTLLFSFISLLVLNIVRIAVLSALLVEKFVYFDIVHQIFWYSLSIIFVLAIWFSAVYLFGVKNIPVYSDFKLILNLIKHPKKN